MFQTIRAATWLSILWLLPTISYFECAWVNPQNDRKHQFFSIRLTCAIFKIDFETVSYIDWNSMTFFKMYRIMQQYICTKMCTYTVIPWPSYTVCKCRYIYSRGSIWSSHDFGVVYARWVYGVTKFQHIPRGHIRHQNVWLMRCE